MSCIALCVFHINCGINSRLDLRYQFVKVLIPILILAPGYAVAVSDSHERSIVGLIPNFDEVIRESLDTVQKITHSRTRHEFVRIPTTRKLRIN